MPLTPRTKAVAAIARAVDTMHRAYWAACNAEGRAIDPADLGAPDGVLDEAHEAAERVATIAAERGVSWADAQDFV